MLIGLTLATIVFFADLYFIIKNMDEAENPTPPPPVAKPRKVVVPTLEEPPTRIEPKVDEKKSNVRARKPKCDK